MYKKLLVLTGLLLLQSSANVLASDLGINVILSGQVSPGVYGQVEIGNAPRPRVVYEQPMVIVTDRHYSQEAPIYLHVPPGHAKHWSQHCREYNACNHRVYFVRSEEYEPEYQSRENHDDNYDDNRDHEDRHHGKGGHGKHGH